MALRSIVPRLCSSRPYLGAALVRCRDSEITVAAPSGPGRPAGRRADGRVGCFCRRGPAAPDHASDDSDSPDDHTADGHAADRVDADGHGATPGASGSSGAPRTAGAERPRRDATVGTSAAVARTRGRRSAERRRKPGQRWLERRGLRWRRSKRRRDECRPGRRDEHESRLPPPPGARLDLPERAAPASPDDARLRPPAAGARRVRARPGLSGMSPRRDLPCPRPQRRQPHSARGPRRAPPARPGHVQDRRPAASGQPRGHAARRRPERERQRDPGRPERERLPKRCSARPRGRLRSGAHTLQRPRCGTHPRSERRRPRSPGGTSGILGQDLRRGRSTRSGMFRSGSTASSSSRSCCWRPGRSSRKRSPGASPHRSSSGSPAPSSCSSRRSPTPSSNAAPFGWPYAAKRRD